MSKHYTHVACTPTTSEWIASYLEEVPKLVFKHGGRYLYRTTAFESVEMPPDLPTTFMVLIEWPDAASAATFYDDPDYERHKQARLSGSMTQWFNAAAYDG